tara:strand:+ start:4677 stop:5159 length:483 start_codon:yes stop_codon:yes gene_type:complete
MKNKLTMKNKMTGFKIKDLVKEKPSHIRNWESLKEKYLYTLKNLDDIEMRKIKGFDIKCKRMLDEATANWISPIIGIDVLIRDKENEFGEYKDIEIFQDKKLVHTHTRFYTSTKDMLISIEDLANEYSHCEIIYSDCLNMQERISKNVRLAVAIIHKLTE